MKPLLLLPALYILRLESNKEQLERLGEPTDDACEEPNFYVGISLNLNQRISQHMTQDASIWTKHYHVKKIVSVKVSEDIDNAYENDITLSMMRKHGWERVRGGSWCGLNIKKPMAL